MSANPGSDPGADTSADTGMDIGMGKATLPTILVVDDAPTNLNVLAGLLSPHYRVKLASSGEKALQLARRAAPDLVLLDIMMPDMDGYEVCRRLKRDAATRRIPVLFLTAMNEPEDEARGFEVGAADFIQKPISPAIVQARVRTHLQIKTYQDELARRNAWLQSALELRMAQVDQLREATLHVMISFAEFRDEETGNHVRRTQEYVRTLANHLREQGLHTQVLDAASIEHISKSAPLHDIGKVAIPDHILLKPGRLVGNELDLMREHAMHGWDMLNRAALRMGDDDGYLRHAMDISRHHHEKWDGSGYPDGLAGEAIPLSARLMSVADVYDALISRRPYKDSMSHQHAAITSCKAAARISTRWSSRPFRTVRNSSCTSPVPGVTNERALNLILRK